MIHIISGLIFSSLFTGGAALPAQTAQMTAVNTVEMRPLTQTQKEEILWLARLVYSETKIRSEMELVAWVARNRVEAQYRGTTYKEVALAKKQFSGLNPGDPQYHTNISLTYDDPYPAWQKAIAVAQDVYMADADDRPIAKEVRHFYSPRSVSTTPSWSKEGELHYKIIDPKTDEVRFAFYSGVK